MLPRPNTHSPYQSEDGEGFLVLVHDKAHDSTGGSVRWKIKAEAKSEVMWMTVV